MITSAPVTLPWPRIGMATNFVKAFISAASVSSAALFMCLPRVIDRPMPKKMQPNLARFMRSMRSSSGSRVRPVSAICSSPTCWPLTIARRIVISSKSLPGRTCRKMSAALALLRFANIDQHHRAVLAAAREKLALLHDGVLREMARMALGRIAAPIHDEVGSLLHFAERASDFATQLGGDLGGTVSQRGVTVEQPPELVGQRHRTPSGPRTWCCSCRRPAACRLRAGSWRPLRSPRRASLPGRRSGHRDISSRPCDSGTRRCRARRPSSPCECASSSWCSWMSSHTQPQKVQVAFLMMVRVIRGSIPLVVPSRPPGPGGTTNVQPSSRPGKLPRIRRGR